MAKDFIYKIRNGEALPSSDPNGFRLILTDSGEIKLLGSDGSIAPLQVESSGSEVTETIVNISSTQILSAGTQPIELLPAPGVGKYYNWDITLEYLHNTTPYNTTSSILVGDVDNYSAAIMHSSIITSNVNQVITVSSKAKYGEAGVENGVTVGYSMGLNKGVYLFTYTQANPTLGDGTIRAIIAYTVRTFGA